MTAMIAPQATMPFAASGAGTVVPAADSAVPGQLAPGADTPFVWGAYGVSLLVLAALWWRSRRQLQRAGEIGAKGRRAGNAGEDRS